MTPALSNSVASLGRRGDAAASDIAELLRWLDARTEDCYLEVSRINGTDQAALAQLLVDDGWTRTGRVLRLGGCYGDKPALAPRDYHDQQFSMLCRLVDLADHHDIPVYRPGDCRGCGIEHLACDLIDAGWRDQHGRPHGMFDTVPPNAAQRSTDEDALTAWLLAHPADCFLTRLLAAAGADTVAQSIVTGPGWWSRIGRPQGPQARATPTAADATRQRDMIEPLSRRLTAQEDAAERDGLVRVINECGICTAYTLARDLIHAGWRQS